jgi:hypothetical protein
MHVKSPVAEHSVTQNKFWEETANPSAFQVLQSL